MQVARTSAGYFALPPLRAPCRRRGEGEAQAALRGAVARIGAVAIGFRIVVPQEQDDDSQGEAADIRFRRAEAAEARRRIANGCRSRWNPFQMPKATAGESHDPPAAPAGIVQTPHKHRQGRAGNQDEQAESRPSATARQEDQVDRGERQAKNSHKQHEIEQLPPRRAAAEIGEMRSGRSARSLPFMRYRTSNSPAAPMPPPTHIVTTTYFVPRRLPSIRAWPVIRAPDMP